jgi:hypothetical protein
MADLDPQAVENLKRSLADLGLSADKVDKIFGNVNQTLKMSKASFENISKSLKDLNKDAKDGSKSYKDLGQDLRYYQKQINELTDAKDKERAQTKLNILAQKAANDAMVDGVKQVSGKAIAGVFDYYKGQVMTGIRGIQGDGSPFQVAADLQTAAIDSVSNSMTGVAGVGKAVGGALSAIPNPAAQVAGALVSLGSELLSFGAKQAAEALKFQVEVVSKELEKSYKSFQQATAAGALFAGGMTELRNVGLKAGLTQEQFSTAIANNASALAAFGGDVTTGAKRLADVSKAGESSRKSLLKLGISIEDQIQGTAEYMSLLQSSGSLRGKSDEAIARESAEYLTNLKAISDFTGEDAKKAQARAREAATQAAVQAKLAQLGDGATKKFNAMIATLPPSLQKAAQQMLVFGDAVDPDSAAALAQIPAFADVMKSSMADVENQNVSLTDATAKYQQGIKDNQAAIKEQSAGASQNIGAAALAGGSLANMSTVVGEITQVGLKDFSQALTTTTEHADKAKNTNDDLTKGVTDSVVALQDMKIAIQDLLTNSIKNFANEVPKILEGLRTKLEDLGIIDTKGNNAGYNALAGAPMMADGGIASGPTSGYPAILHGTEAVVPLNEGLAKLAFLTSGASLGAGKYQDSSNTALAMDSGTASMVSKTVDDISLASSKLSKDQVREAMLSMPELMGQMQNNLSSGVYSGGASAGNQGFNDAQTRMLELMQKFVDKSEMMEAHLSDQKRLQQQLVDLGQ